MTAQALRDVDIIKIGHRGDGETADGLYVPFTAPGDHVRVDVADDRAQLVEILTAGPTRSVPPCRHFGVCGGCALQHVETSAYRAWKVDQVAHALVQRGITGVEINPLIAVEPRTRRRAVMAARLTRDSIVVGFQERASHFIVDVAECPVLHPALEALIAPLRESLMQELSRQGQAEIGMTLTDSGIDLTLGIPGVTIDGPRRVRLAALASKLDLARLTVNGELIAQSRRPAMRWADVEVALPPGAFLQAVGEAEAAMQRLVLDGIGKSKHVVDLFAGCGAFTFPMARQAAVSAFDGDADAIAALTEAARHAKGLKPVTAERRDLFRRPLLPPELDTFDAAIIDPPRAGAKAQSEQLAKSKLRKIVAVSCNPATFARDARILIDGGYALEAVTPIDQFLWSAHVELVATFERS